MGSISLRVRILVHYGFRQLVVPKRAWSRRAHSSLFEVETVKFLLWKQVVNQILMSNLCNYAQYTS